MDIIKRLREAGKRGAVDTQTHVISLNILDIAEIVSRIEAANKRDADLQMFLSSVHQIVWGAMGHSDPDAMRRELQPLLDRLNAGLKT